MWTHCQWEDFALPTSLCRSALSFVLAFIVERYVGVKLIHPSYLLAEKDPLLVGGGNALVAVIKLSVTYFYPLQWFWTVMLTSTSTAGSRLLPFTFCAGSIFAGSVSLPAAFTASD
ncbi:hypothetical protein PM082_023461 [Marasmius tenuissimus]|nr:hypothetical protein PM082_023461 [Marasmius tenuissimus]